MLKNVGNQKQLAKSLCHGGTENPDHLYRHREGGSGGALAIAVGDTVLMLQYSTYSVISPEGCASILWKSADKAPEAAEILGITADRLKEMGLIDGILPEPIGGAHRDYPATMQSVKQALQESLRKLQDMPSDTLLQRRYERLMGYGKFKLNQPEKSD